LDGKNLEPKKVNTTNNPVERMPVHNIKGRENNEGSLIPREKTKEKEITTSAIVEATSILQIIGL